MATGRPSSSVTGASINVCTGFSYKSLFGEADLSVAGRNLFDAFDTSNFELVLQLLGDARRVGVALGSPPMEQNRIDFEYGDIREALFGAIDATHIEHDEIDDRLFKAIASVMLTYQRVFTTNYDLLAYWSLMTNGRTDQLTDFFLRHGANGPLTFDLITSAGFTQRTQLLHLHGGLHL
jgi:hypothetical protein